jgi:carboxypeptidase family protein
MILRKPFALVAMGSLSLFACGGDSTQSTPASASKAAPAAEAKPAAPAATAGSAAVSGKIAYEGTVPPAEKVKLNADPKCAAMHKDGLERWQLHVKDGGLADVLVYVKSGIKGTFPPPAEPALLDQKGCDYHPHMLAMRTGQPLKIRNSDDTLHNIHPRPQGNPEFNLGQARQGMESTRQFDKAEVMIPVGCDVHPWMRAFISVFDHPFFTVSKEDGTFEIKGLPAGEYEIEAFHGKLKSQAQKVTVKDGESATLNFTFKG